VVGFMPLGFIQGTSLSLLTEWELAGLQSRSRRLGGENNISPLSGIEQFTVVDPAPQSLC